MLAILRADWFKYLVFALLFCIGGCQEAQPYEVYQNSLKSFEQGEREQSPTQQKFFSEFSVLYQALLPKQKPLPKPHAQDWLAEHHEAGQNFFEFAQVYPSRGEAPLSIYAVRIGEFNEEEERVYQACMDYISLFYGIQFIQKTDLVLDSIEEKRGRSGKWELNSTHLIQEVLPSISDKTCPRVVAFTMHNLYPTENLTYVFGQASAKHQSAVISFKRLMADHQKRLIQHIRAFKLTGHELGHLLGFEHCIAFSCVMNGFNHLEELNHSPVQLCPDCLAKYHWTHDRSPKQRFVELYKFWKQKNNFRMNLYKEFCELSTF